MILVSGSILAREDAFGEVPRAFVGVATSVGLFQPLGIEAEFLGHLDKLLRGLGILDGTGQSLGSDGLVAIVICLGHVSTFLDR